MKNIFTNLFIGIILFVLPAIMVIVLYSNDRIAVYLFGFSYRETMWTAIASTIAVCTFSGFFIMREIDQRSLRQSLRALLAQELIENLKRSFYGGAEIEFQTMGFHSLKSNLSLVKDFEKFYMLSDLYIEFDYCISYPKTETVNRNKQRLKTGFIVIDYLIKHTNSSVLLEKLVEIKNAYSVDPNREDIIIEGKYRDELFIAAKSLLVGDLIHNLEKHLKSIF